MATRESDGMGIDHLTVVPENFDVEPTPEESSIEGTDGDADAA
ncbi:MAG: hypothetical protein ABEJ05_13695 [Haloglomus sp.]